MGLSSQVKPRGSPWDKVGHLPLCTAQGVGNSLYSYPREQRGFFHLSNLEELRNFSHFKHFYLPWSIGQKCDGNDCLSQVKDLHLVLEERKA